jgi:mannan polymerase II complex MNN10 subunit
MLFRSNPRVSAFLTRALACRDEGLPDKDNPNEQHCFNHLLKENQYGEAERVVFAPQWTMNAYPEEMPCYDEFKRKWEPGMFVVHFAGAWVWITNVTDAKGELFNRYHRRVVY